MFLLSFKLVVHNRGAASSYCHFLKDRTQKSIIWFKIDKRDKRDNEVDKVYEYRYNN